MKKFGVANKGIVASLEFLRVVIRHQFSLFQNRVDGFLLFVGRIAILGQGPADDNHQLCS